MEGNSLHASRLVYPPIVHIVWGSILLLFFIAGCMIQVQTNEAWFLHSSDPSAWIPNLNLFAQFPEFWSGRMSANQVVAFLGAWCIQIVLISMKIGLASVQATMMKKYGHGNTGHVDVQKSARWRGGLWDIVSGLIVLGNSLIDFVYALPLGWLQGLVFAAAIFLTSFYAGTHGIQNISAGLTDMKRG
jgi:hypothetical protein